MKKKMLPVGPACDLRDAVYRLYAEADYPTLAQLAEQIAEEDDLPGKPGRDLISKVISGDGLAGQQDTVTVAVALARAAGRQDIARIAAQIRQLWMAAPLVEPIPPVEPAPPVQRLGQPVSECDPLVLQVHQAIQIPDADTSQDPLPGYVPRVHDSQLREIADRVLDAGRSQLVTLVGEPSTGKTRACWELARYLDQQQPGQWRVWHPYDPTPPQAAMADLQQASAHTIVWLNEAQQYLMTADPGLGERLAAGLRTLLVDPGRAPVIVLATLWPRYRDTLTVRPGAGQPDPYAQARDLLTLGVQVTVSDTFTPSELEGLSGPAIDARLRQAAQHAENGRITQYLAGAPALEDRYRGAPPAVRAILHVAMDARRLGHPLALPYALLEHAAPGYLNEHKWDHPGGDQYDWGDDWLEQALVYATTRLTGARGPFTRLRPRGWPLDGGPYYRLADYLEQTGRTERAGVYPPDSLWQAFATTSTDPDLLNALANHACQRGRYQHAIWLWRQAANRGDTRALRGLAVLREQAGDGMGAEVLWRQAADRGDMEALQMLVERREQAGDHASAEALVIRAADRGDMGALQMLAELREQAGDTDGAEALVIRAADRGDMEALQKLAERRVQRNDLDGAETLYRQAADRGADGALRVLAELRERAHDRDGAEALYRQAAARGDTDALLELAELLGARDSDGAEALYQQAADRGSTEALRRLVQRRRRAGDRDGAESLVIQAAARGHMGALQMLAELREQAGDADGAEALAIRAADRGDVGVLWVLAELRERAHDRDGAEALYRQAAARGDTDALRALALLREKAGDNDRAEALYRRAADRGSTEALWELVELRQRTGDPDGAQALVMLSGDISALRRLARARARAGDLDSTLDLVMRAADRGDMGALRESAKLLERAGDSGGAKTLYRLAADRGHTGAMRRLARARAQAGDLGGAEALYRQTADRGDTNALGELAELRQRAGDPESSGRIRRFGLTGSGEIATGLDFESPVFNPSTWGAPQHHTRERHHRASG